MSEHTKLPAHSFGAKAEREAIADWLWKYANSPKWRAADEGGEIRHFVGHAMDYIKSGAYRGTRIRLLRTVISELPFPPFLKAEARVYEAAELNINPQGAVSIRLPGGLLGVKPGEFEWVTEP